MRIKLSSPDDFPDGNFSQFTGSGHNFQGVEFFFNEQVHEADAWFISEGTRPTDTVCLVPPNRVFFLGTETARPPDFFLSSEDRLDFLRQFHEQHGPLYVPFESYRPSMPFLPWMVNSNHGPSILANHERDYDFFSSLEKLDKPKMISVICSTKTLTPEHRYRLSFVERLCNTFGDAIDWFGNGVLPLEQKWDGLAPYRYTVVLENQSAPRVLTEKLQDAFLALSFPIYWGDPLAPSIFPSTSFMEIDIGDFARTARKIELLLGEDPYESLLPDLIEAKDRVLHKVHFLRRILAVLASPTLREPLAPELVSIRRPEDFAAERLRTPVERISVIRNVNQFVKRFLR